MDNAGERYQILFDFMMSIIINDLKNIFVRDYVFDEHLCPDLETFREMFEQDKNIQDLADEELYEH